jgi:MFS family permease
MTAYILSFVDRQILSMLIVPVQTDLGISDTQFGLLHGLAFAVFYAIMGLPIAQLSDQKSRPLIIATGVFFWSLATVACGFTRSFIQLFIARMCVGAGEATLAPATYSLISDLFPKDKLGRAVAVFSLGAFIGAGMAFILGGLVIELVSKPGAGFPGLGTLRPWQQIFVLAGLPGILVSLIIVLTIRDPGRKEERSETGKALDASIGEVYRFFNNHRTLMFMHFAGYSCFAMAGFVVLGWSPAYLMRHFDMNAQDSAYWLGLIVLCSCTAGVYTSGWLMDYLLKRGREDATFLTGVIGAAMLAVSAAALPFVRNFDQALAVLTLILFFAAFPMPPSTGFIQTVAPNRMRARLSAAFLFCNSLIGLAGGSILVGLSNDYIFGNPKAVGLSMSMVVLGAAIASAVILGLGLKPLRTHFQIRTQLGPGATLVAATSRQ